MTPTNNQGVKYGNHQQTRSLEQGKARRPEATAQAEGYLGHPHPPPECPLGPQSCHVQLGHRQQVAWLRSCQLAGARHHPRKSGVIPCHGDPEENTATSAVRIDRTYEVSSVGLAGKISPTRRSVPVSEQGCKVTPCFDASIRTDRALLGRICRP